MDMQRMATIGAAACGAAVLVADAHAQNSGYAKFSRTSDTVRIIGNTGFQQGDFTYEMRIRLQPGAPLGHVVSEQQTSVEDKIVKLGADGSYSASACYPDATGVFTGTIDGLPSGQWMHFAYVHTGSQVRFYVDGSLRATRVPVGCYTDSSGSNMSLGMFRYGGFVTYPSFLGDLDWIRVSAGARYTTDFAPPFECEVLSDAATQLLLKFNEPAGTATLFDESPNQFVCDLGVPVAPGVTATSPSLGNSTGGFPSCAPTCTADIDGNSIVDGVDLAIILGRWGTNPKDYPRADTNGDGIVNGADLTEVLGGWGNCP